MTTAVVVGGGLAGLSCAVALAGRGVAVTVLEAAERLGGRASSWRDGHSSDSVDIGPHIFHSEYHNMLGFLERRPGQRSPVPGLVLAGDWTRTRMPCTMEGAVKSGALAAETVLEDLGRPEKLAIESRMYDGVAGMVRRAAVKRGRP